MVWPFRRPENKDELDTPLLSWSPHDVLTLRGLLNGGISILGTTGSGKSTASGKCLREAIVANPNSSGTICGSKPEELGAWQDAFARARRSKDLLVMEPGGPLRINLLDEVAQLGFGTREITRFLMTVGESLDRGNNGRRGDDGGSFWEREQARQIHHGVSVVKLATGQVTAPDLQKFFVSAAMGKSQLREPTWQSGFQAQCIDAADFKPKSTVEAHDFELACDYWLQEFCTMADKMRSGINTGVLGILFVFNSGVIRETVSTTTDVHIKDLIENRKWLYINAPPSSYGATGIFLNTAIKLLTQMAVLQRDVKPGDPFHVTWCDEAHQVANSGEVPYVAQCRSHYGCLVFLSQSLPSYYTAFSGEDGKQQAQAFLANFGHNILHTLGDADSAEWASEKLGVRLETFVGGSMQPAQDIFDELFGRQSFSGNFSTQYVPVLHTNAFMHGLRTGGKRNAFFADAIVIKPGEPFANGQNWIKVAFSQR